MKPCQKYKLIKEVLRKNKQISTSVLLDIARVSNSGYYKWLKTSNELDKDHEDYLVVKEVFDDGKGKLGHRAVCMNLKSDKDIIMNHKKVMRIMNKYGLVTKIRRANPYKQIGKKTHEHRTFENLLNREFAQKTPYHFFGTDITYMFFNNRPAYLSVIKDIASGEIVAWELSRHIDMGLVLGTVENMKNNPHLRTLSFENVMIHSDQGFHYTNPLYINLVKDLDMIQSMSRKGNCIDNAPTESFFGHMKDDVDYKSCKTFEELRYLIDRYMNYYNFHRCQWDLKKMTPVQYRDHLLTKSTQR
ncbi:IS3 family transposase [Patescibacteria group bacterium]